MRKILTLILILLSVTCSFEKAQCAQFKNFRQNQNSVEVKQSADKKGQMPGLFSIAKFVAEYEVAANGSDLKKFMNFYSDEYLSNDGFDKTIVEKNIKKTWESYPQIKYKLRLNGVTFSNKNNATIDITETATGYAKLEHGRMADFKCTTQVIYYLKQVDKSWIITGETSLKEDILLRWGDAKRAQISLDAPVQISAGKEYSAVLSITQSEGVIAIGSITSDKITYPISNSKEIFHKFSSDGTIERIMKSNSDNTNEYVVATVGFTRPRLDNNKNLDINLSGYACLMQRMNVIPVNKFIEVKNEQLK